jgi:hypothetical protein
VVAHPLDNPETLQVLLGQLRVGRAFGTACKAVHCTRRSVLGWLERNPEAAAQSVEAELEATETVEEVLYESARAGERWAVEKWLDARAADRWAPVAAGAARGGGALVLDPGALMELEQETGTAS